MKDLFYRRILILILFTSSSLSFSQNIEVTKIWDKAPHNAFTDLIRFKNCFYCTFREGKSHVPKDTSENGKIRILKSRNGRDWESVALLSHRNYDLRDSKLSVTPDKRLMILMGGSHYENGQLLYMLTHVSFSEDGNIFTVPVPVSIDESIRTPFDWIWRITWKGSTGYAVVYQSRQPDIISRIALVKTQNGIDWQQVKQFDIKPFPNEATIRFDNDGKMIILLRRDSNANGMLGESMPPYLEWKWTELGYRLGGPNFLILNDNRLCIGTRLYMADGAKTIIYLTDRGGRIQNALELPSGGDTSYPGFILFRGRLWVSYYSSHEGKSSIYFTRLKLTEIPAF